MFTEAQMLQLGVMVFVAIGAIVLPATAFIVSALNAGKRTLDDVHKETEGAKARGTEVQANVRTLTNGQSVHHAAPEPAPPQPRRRRKSDKPQPGGSAGA